MWICSVRQRIKGTDWNWKEKNQGLDKGFTSNKDNENVNEPLIKDEKKKYNRLRFYSNSDDKKLDSLSFK